MPPVNEPDDLPEDDLPPRRRTDASRGHADDPLGDDPLAADPLAADPMAPDPLAPDPAIPAEGARREWATSAHDPDGTPSAGEEPPARRSRAGRTPVPLTQQIGRIAIVILAILFGIFAVVNSQAVGFSWVFGETYVRPDPAGEGEIGGVPLIVLLVAAFVIGAMLGALLQWYSARSRRARKEA